MSCKPQIDQLCLTSHKVGFMNLYLQKFFQGMNELESLLNITELIFPNLPALSQGVEREVKLTMENSHVMYGQEARHKHIILATKDQHFRQKENTLNNSVLLLYILYYFYLF